MAVYDGLWEWPSRGMAVHGRLGAWQSMAVHGSLGEWWSMAV